MGIFPLIGPLFDGRFHPLKPISSSGADLSGAEGPAKGFDARARRADTSAHAVGFPIRESGDVRAIAAMLVDELVRRLQAAGKVDMLVEDAVLDKLAADGFDPVYGALPLRREVERQLAARIVTGECPDGSRVHVREGQIGFEVGGRGGPPRGNRARSESPRSRPATPVIRIAPRLTMFVEAVLWTQAVACATCP